MFDIPSYDLYFTFSTVNDNVLRIICIFKLYNIFSNVRMARIEYKYLIYKQTSQYPGQGLGFTFAFSIKPKIFVVSTVLYYKIGCK